VATSLWITAIAMLGGALISLALRFPVEWGPVARRSWLLALPYVVSAGMAVWAIFALGDLENPWLYLSVRSLSYRYVALAALFFLGVMAYRSGQPGLPVARRQARLVLLGSAMAFIPIIVWFLAPLFGSGLPFNSAVLLPGLLIFPLSVALAIVRYRMLEIDALVNRAIVYACLTAILAGVFTAAIGLSQRLFVTLTGEKSDAAVVLTTLIVASAVTPIRTRLQAWVDRRFRERPTGGLASFGDQVLSFVQMSNAGMLTRRLLDEAARSLGASSGAMTLVKDGQAEIVHTYGMWRGRALLSVPIVEGEDNYGYLMLGPRRSGKNYQRFEAEALQDVASRVALALRLAGGNAGGEAD
jgi:hypothetical protein